MWAEEVWGINAGFFSPIFVQHQQMDLPVSWGFEKSLSLRKIIMSLGGKNWLCYGEN